MAAWVLALCACEPFYSYRNSYVDDFATPNPVPDNFFTCYGYGCKYRTRISLASAEWRSVRGYFDPPPADAHAERRQIAKAVAQMELLVSERTGTHVHQRRGFNGGDATQLDCIDESINTYTYMTMFERDGLLRYHRVGGLAFGGTLWDFDVRNTAVLVASATDERYAIDPTRVDSGVPPPVFPLSLWKGDWPPEIPDEYWRDDLPDAF